MSLSAPAAGASSPIPISAARQTLFLSAVCFLLAVLLYYPSLYRLYVCWTWDEYFAHGPFLPFLSAFLIWNRREEIKQAWLSVSPTPRVPWLLMMGLALQLVGKLGDINNLQVLSFLIVVLGLAQFLGGTRLERHLRFPILYLGMGIPISDPLCETLIVPLQTQAAACSAVCLGLIGIPVTRSGVNLYTSHYNFTVAIPCSGLKIAITLLTIGILVAHLLPELRQQQRWLLGILCIPFALVANTFRIVLIVLIGHWFGMKAAEGFLHGFSGIVMFIVAMGLLVGTGLLLRREQSMEDQGPGWNLPGDFHPVHPNLYQTAGPAGLVHGKLVVISALCALTWLLGSYGLVAPASQTRVALPPTLGPWVGKPEIVDPGVFEILHPDAAVRKRYTLLTSPPHPAPQVDVVVIFSRDLRKFHSLATCLSTGGWAILSEEDRPIQYGASSVMVHIVNGEKGSQHIQQADFYEDTQQAVTGWLPLLTRSMTSRILLRPTGVFKVYLSYDPSLVQLNGEFTPPLKDLIGRIAESLLQPSQKS